MILEKLFGITSALAEEAGAAGAAAAGEEAAANPIAALLTTFLPMVLIFVVFYLQTVASDTKFGNFLLCIVIFYLPF